MNFFPRAFDIGMREKPLVQVRGGALGGADDEEVGQASQTLSIVPTRVLAVVRVWGRFLAKHTVNKQNKVQTTALLFID